MVPRCYKTFLIVAGILTVGVPMTNAQGAGQGNGGDGKSAHIATKDCQKIVRHSASADVAYKPGVDVYGRKVAGADLGGGSTLKLPDEIAISLDIDLADKYGISAGGLATPEANVGKVTYKAGQVYYNGQRLDSSDEAAIAEACRKRGAQ